LLSDLDVSHCGARVPRPDDKSTRNHPLLTHTRSVDFGVHLSVSPQTEPVQIRRSDERPAAIDDHRLGVHHRSVPVPDFESGFEQPTQAMLRGEADEKWMTRRGQDQLHIHAAAAGSDECLRQRWRWHGVLVQTPTVTLNYLDQGPT
jgi:hypothetical protein